MVKKTLITEEIMLTSASYNCQITVYQKRSIKLNKDILKTRTESKEQILLQSIAEGNRHAFWQLWLLYQDYLYRRCQMWMGGNHTDAEEALSRARLKAWEKLPNYASTITNPKAWLTRMTHNLCVDIHRERQRRAKNTESMDAITVTDSEIIASNLDSPESAILRQELKIYIRRAINALPPRLREPMILLCYYQMSYSDIAKKLILSKNSVYKRIQQARTILQKQLNKYFSGVNNTFKQETERNFAAKAFPIEKPELSYSSVPIVKEYPIQVINYEVTALCLEKFSLA
ncbi:MAG: RNA polymerase sigma factor [Xenococcaceae cyanobacterium MO_207.B15]|nr:RNA polymerase sigma factor [Xenococcaceae cyanobacterium MO_207.B15]MDJ0744032.1 RNA polymerase sigma factor [Xenococcaceae cyanobacterium MO_167.B27]